MRRRDDPGTRLPWDPPPGRWLRRLAMATGVGVLVLFAAVVAAYLFMPIPDPNDQAISQISTVYYAGGEQELGRLGEANRVSVPLARVPQHVRDAVIAAENRGFYTESGVSARGIARALLTNLRGDALQGGSTITQQYVKNYYLTQDRTLARKVKEVMIALKIDRRLSKDEILANYLNTIYFGRGSYGVQVAAKSYFGKDVDRLTLAEGAVLAALIRSPGRYDPVESRAALEGRMRYVLDAMTQTGAISLEEAATQRLPSFRSPQAGRRYGGQNGYVFSAVIAELERRGVPAQQIHAGGLRIETTLDRRVQRAALAAVEREQPRTKAKGLRVGLAAVEPGTGRVVAMYGGADYLAGRPHAQENNAMAKVQPGSVFKALALAAGLGDGVDLSDRFAGNSPLPLPGSAPVRNQKNKDWGRSVSLLTATRESINTAFVDLCMQVGPRKVAAAAERAGIPADQMVGNVNARLALGIAPVSALQMAGAYATFAAEGERADPHLVERVRGPDGDEIELDPIVRKRVFEEDVAADVTYALRQVVRTGTGTRALGLGRPAAAKTGTHEGPNGIQTAWFAGYTPQLSTAVSFFRGDGTESLGGVGGLKTFTGGRYPAQVWTAFMRAALSGTRVESFPGRSADDDPFAGERDDPGAGPAGPAATATVTPAPTSSPTETSRPTRSPSSRPPIVDCPFICPSRSPSPTEDDPATATASPGG